MWTQLIFRQMNWLKQGLTSRPIFLWKVSRPCISAAFPFMSCSDAADFSWPAFSGFTFHFSSCVVFDAFQVKVIWAKSCARRPFDTSWAVAMQVELGGWGLFITQPTIQSTANHSKCFLWPLIVITTIHRIYRLENLQNWKFRRPYKWRGVTAK